MLFFAVLLKKAEPSSVVEEVEGDDDDDESDAEEGDVDADKVGDGDGEKLSNESS